MTNSPSLDLYSTSPTGLGLKCSYATIYFACEIGEKRYSVLQGCCNHWDCPRCGQIRAKTEYVRIVHGIETLSSEGFDIYFHTITCRGKEISTSDAEKGYLGWTNKFLDSYRQQVKRAGGHWCYVQVTERQKRGHPHSHILTTFCPPDLREGYVEKWSRRQGELIVEQKAALRSDWLQENSTRSGLGEQYDISKVRTQAAASRYVAKYLFKQTALSSDWPKGWKRVRYSQSFPKLPDIKTNAFVLRDFRDWERLSSLAVTVRCSEIDTYEYTQFKLMNSDTVVILKKDK